MRKLFVALAALAVLQLSPALAAERDVIERARLAFSEQLQLVCSAAGEYDWIAENAVYQYPLHDINVKLRVEGRDAVAAHLRAVADVSPDIRVENIRYYPTLKHDVVFVQYDRVSVDGIGERRPIVAIIEMDGDRIANFTQLNGTRESIQAVKAGAGAID